MTKSFRNLSKLLASFACGRRRWTNFSALAICALTAGMANPVRAQLADGLTLPGSQVVGTAAAFDPTGAAEGSSGVFVGASTTDSTQVASGTGPATASSPVRGRLVSQPFAQGPFMQDAPVVHSDGGGYDICCPDGGCDLRYYTSAEALYFQRRGDEGFTLATGRKFNSFDYEWAGRITLGRMFDCVNAVEAVYAGPFHWRRNDFATGIPVASRFVTSGGYLPAQITGFTNATTFRQSQSARMNVVELNRRWWAWDVFSIMIGVRGVDYREAYGISTVAPGNVLSAGVTNLMLGPQIGGDFMQPVGLRTLVGIRGKAALLANFNDSTTRAIINNALLVNSASGTDVDVAGMFEFGTYVKYSITPSIRAQGGYDIWYLPGVATIDEQGLNNISPFLGDKSRATGEVLVHGASAGLEILF